MHLTQLTKRLIAALLAVTLIAPTYAAAPNQYNPNTVVPTGIDNSTGNAAVPYVDHTTGATTVIISGASAPLSINASGVAAVSTEGTTPTYRATIADLAPAASATDVTTICGSATKTVKVKYVQASADATNVSSVDFYIFLRTAADTGGTSSVVASIAADPASDPAATAVIRSYNSNPASLGTGTVVVGDHYALAAIASTGYPITQWVETFGTRNGQPLILRGTSQCVAFGLNGQTIPAGMSLYVNWEWTEE